MNDLLSVPVIIVALAWSTGCGPGAESNSPPAAEPSQVADAPQTHHTIDYIEISVHDMARAQAFYGDAFGWTFTDYGPEYAGIRKEVGEAGGLRQVDEVTTGGPLVILYSADLEASAASVRDAGGTITMDIFEFPGGRRFQFEDPSGNELAVWSDR